MSLSHTFPTCEPSIKLIKADLFLFNEYWFRYNYQHFCSQMLPRGRFAIDQMFGLYKSAAHFSTSEPDILDIWTRMVAEAHSRGASVTPSLWLITPGLYAHVLPPKIGFSDICKSILVLNHIYEYERGGRYYLLLTIPKQYLIYFSCMIVCLSLLYRSVHISFSHLIN